MAVFTTASSNPITRPCRVIPRYGVACRLQEGDDERTEDTTIQSDIPVQLDTEEGI